MKKEIFLILVFLLVFGISSVSAIDFEISSTPILNIIMNDEGKPAIFNIIITNNGEAGNFEMYTFERFSISPNEFSLTKDETKVIRVEFLPIDSMLENSGHLKVPIFFREKGASETQEHSISITLVSFEEVFSISTQNLNPESKSVVISFYNIQDFMYDNVNLVFSSSFFNTKQLVLDLKPYEKKDFTIEIDENSFKKLVAGTYYYTVTYTVDGKTDSLEGPIKILEKSGLSISEDVSGLIIRSQIIEKTNEGNIPTIAEINVRKNIITRLFTTFSQEPLRVERNAGFIDYYWQKELQPSESLKVKTTTNFIFPLLLLISILLIIYLFNIYVSSNLVVKKRVSFVNTKGGEFALKVTLNVKARKFIERVRIYDKLPGMSKLYERFGTKPDDFNQSSGTMQWNFDHLAEGEERVISYVIFSKLRVVGKFELSSATGIYEMEGRIHETKSNSSFFINEPKDSQEPDLG